MNTDVSARLEGLTGRLLDAGNTADTMLWRTEEDRLELPIEEALALLGEKQRTADGCSLILQRSEGDAPAETESKRVDIVTIEYHEAVRAIIAELREREGSERVGEGAAAVSNGDIDEALEDSFPASDPPSFTRGET